MLLNTERQFRRNNCIYFLFCVHATYSTFEATITTRKNWSQSFSYGYATIYQNAYAG